MAGGQIQRRDYTQDAELARADGPGSMMEVAAARASQEVQGAMVIAKRFPRDEVACETRIVKACQRLGLAEQAFYSYSKGGTKIFGPSVHLARVMAAQWGNCKAGWTVLSQSEDESVVEAFCWDYETNHNQSITFIVQHAIKASGSIKKLTDPRDIYEHTANMAARRVRACILAVLPPDVQDAAVEACKKTLGGQGGKPLIDRVKAMVMAFDQHGVSQPMIEDFLGHKIDATDEAEFIRLRGIWQSLKDGMSKREDWFDVAPETNDPADLKAGKKRTVRKPAPSEPAPVNPPEDEEALPQFSPDDTPPLFDGPQPTAEETADEIKETLGGDIPKSDLDRYLDLKLATAKAERTEFNRRKVLGFALLGSEIDLSTPLTPEGERVAIERVKALTKTDVEEALG